MLRCEVDSCALSNQSNVRDRPDYSLFFATGIAFNTKIAQAFTGLQVKTVAKCADGLKGVAWVPKECDWLKHGFLACGTNQMQP